MPYDEHNPEERVARSLQQLIDDLPEQVGVLDEQFNILAINHHWRTAAEQYGFEGAGAGCNYREFCTRLAAEGYKPAAKVLDGIAAIGRGKRDHWELIYDGGSRWSGRHFELCFHRMSVNDVRLILVTRSDLTEVCELRRAKDALTSLAFAAEAKERQRIARELHDSTSQLIVSAGLLLGSLKDHPQPAEAAPLVDEVRGLLDDALAEIRTMSFLAYPSEFETVQFGQALKSLVEGFARRAGLDAQCDIDGELQLAGAVRNTLYRVAQEALSNVHRHASATRVSVTFRRARSAAQLVIADDGVGISHKTIAGAGNAGVGLASMRSRLLGVGGRLSVKRLSRGTAVVASVSLSESD